MTNLFPYDNLIIGVLILIVGFVFHFIGQLISLVNWDFAIRIGLQEKNLPAPYKAYEHGIAVSDVAIGWTYGVAGVGLIMGAEWGYSLAWIPGAILTYHGIGFWVWTQDQKRDGSPTAGDKLRWMWSIANVGTGLLALILAFNRS